MCVNPKLEYITKVIVESRKADVSDIHLQKDLPPAITLMNSVGFGKNELAKPITINEIEAFYEEYVKSPDSKRQFQEKGICDDSIVEGPLAPLRIHVSRAIGSKTLTLRILPRVIPELEALNLPRGVTEHFVNAREKLWLVIGPTDSGKSTTLASVAKRIIDTQSRKIGIIDDSLEYVQLPNRSLVKQFRVPQDVPTYQDGIIGWRREALHVGVIGEVRTFEAASALLEICASGLKVFATGFGGDAGEAIATLIQMFPPERETFVRATLASVLGGVLVQRLIKRKDNTGRLVATELLFNTIGVGNAIREGKYDQIRNQISSAKDGVDMGSHKLEWSLKHHVEKGVLSFDEARSFARYPDDFDNAVVGGNWL
jgi:twitching motility protein PilT